MKKRVILLLGLILFLTLTVSAEQTVKTLNIPLGYDAIVSANDIKYYNLSVYYPDGINRVISMEILVQGDYLAGTNLYGGFLAGKTAIFCEPSVWTVYRDADNYEASFDCTSLLQDAKWKGGNLQFIIMGTQIMGNIKPRVQLTYENKPKVQIEVFGTEYIYREGEQAKVWVQLINENQTEYIENAICQVHIYTPDNNVLVEKATMSYHEDGIYYYDLAIPVGDGVYPTIAECFFDAFQDINLASGFTLVDGVNVANSYPSTWIEDNVFHKIRENNFGSGIRYFNLWYNFTSVPVPDVNVTLGLTIYWNGKWSSSNFADEITLWILNQSDQTLIELPNKILTINGDQITVNTISATNENLTELGYISSDGRIDILINDTISPPDGANTVLQTDHFYVSLDRAGEGEWQEIKGASEIHVTSDQQYRTALIFGKLTNISFTRDFTFHYQVSGSSISTVETDVKFSLWKPFPCSHIINVSRNYGNGTLLELNYTGTTNSDTSLGCEVVVPLEISSTDTFDIEIKSFNDWKQHFSYFRSTKLLQVEMINISCQNYVLANNMTNFSFPLSSVSYTEDALWLSCASYLDLYYHLNTDTYTQFDPILNSNINFTVNQMEMLNDEWLHLLKVILELDTYANTIFNGLNLANSFSLSLLTDPYPPVNPLYAKYFAQISTSYLTYVQIGLLPANTWVYEPRNVSVEVNTTVIAQDVWNYSNGRYTHGVVI